MSLGIPALVSSSGGEAGGWHTKGEWWTPEGAWKDAQIGLATVLALVGVKDVSEPLLPKRAKWAAARVDPTDAQSSPTVDSVFARCCNLTCSGS